MKYLTLALALLLTACSPESPTWEEVDAVIVKTCDDQPDHPACTK